MTRDFDLADYDACVLDLDGTVWLGTTPIPGAAAFLDECRRRGITVGFATNAVVHTPRHLLAQLVSCGLARDDEQVVTSGLVMIRTLLAASVRWIAGVMAPALAEQLGEVGIEVVSPNEVDARSFGAPGDGTALVLSSHRGATIGEIERLGRLVVAGHPLYLTSREPGFPIEGGMEPGGGVLMAALSLMYPSAAPTVVGKPSTFYAEVVAEVAGVDRTRLLMVGDSQRADIGIATELGCDGLLVTDHSVAVLDPQLPAPTFVAGSLAEPPRPFDPTGGGTAGG